MNDFMDRVQKRAKEESIPSFSMTREQLGRLHEIMREELEKQELQRLHEPRMVCIGVPKKHFLHFSHFPGCGEKWDKDFPDGKCPICRGYLIPSTMVGPQHKFVDKQSNALQSNA